MDYIKRGFLNSDKGMAAFQADVETGSGGTSDYVSAYFTLSDCSRSVSLDFCSYGKEDSIERLKKLDLIISELQAFKKQLIKAAKEME